uniref:Uncharacterized protein n=1 Tax=Oryza punctata TaxID=4537 RepID=A0A0E0MEQ1_ORYPU
MWLHVRLRSMTYEVKSLIDRGNLPTTLAHSSARPYPIMITQLHYHLTRAMAMAMAGGVAAAFPGDGARLQQRAAALERGGRGGLGGAARLSGTARMWRTSSPELGKEREKEGKNGGAASAETRNPTRPGSSHENMWLHVRLRSMTYEVKSLIDRGNLPTTLAHSSAVGSHRDHTR